MNHHVKRGIDLSVDALNKKPNIYRVKSCKHEWIFKRRNSLKEVIVTVAGRNDD